MKINKYLTWKLKNVPIVFINDFEKQIMIKGIEVQTTQSLERQLNTIENNSLNHYHYDKIVEEDDDDSINYTLQDLIDDDKDVLRREDYLNHFKNKNNEQS